VKRIRVDIAPGVETEFVDRDRALAQIAEWAEKSTRWPVVIFGPEGCGKTAFLRQAAAMLRDLGYDVFYLHPLDRVFAAEVDDADVKSLFADLVRKTWRTRGGAGWRWRFRPHAGDPEEAEAENRHHR